MRPINIQRNSTLPIYAQIVTAVESMIRGGQLKDNEPLPSMNALADELDISLETVRRAYKILRGRGLLRSSQGMGFFACARNENAPYRILLLFDRLTSYRTVTYRSLIAHLGKKAETTIHLYNHDMDLFEAFVQESVDKYDYYLIVPHFFNEDPSRLRRIVSRIPRHKLIILDREIEGLTGQFGSVYEASMEDAYTALSTNGDILDKYRDIQIVTSQNSLYRNIILPAMDRAIAERGRTYTVTEGFSPEQMRKGRLFIIIAGQMDTDHFNIRRTAREAGLVFGRDVGLVSYNDCPENEFIGEGLACLSTDFAEMGRQAAEMISRGRMERIHNRFYLIRRGSV